jgi:hypothetical protein
MLHHLPPSQGLTANISLPRSLSLKKRFSIWGGILLPEDRTRVNPAREIMGAVLNRSSHEKVIAGLGPSVNIFARKQQAPAAY